MANEVDFPNAPPLQSDISQLGNTPLTVSWLQWFNQIYLYLQSLQENFEAIAAGNKAGQALDILSALKQQVDLLAAAPPVQEFKRNRYGSFYDTTTQSAAVVNTAQAITFNTTDLSRGVYIGSPTSRIYVDTEGVYDFQLSLQLDSTVSTDERFYLWFAKNGVDVPDSASTVRLKGNNAELILSLNYFFNLKANDYIEVMFSATDLGVQILYAAAAPPVPAIPSVILTVNNGIQGVK